MQSNIKSVACVIVISLVSILSFFWFLLNILHKFPLLQFFQAFQRNPDNDLLFERYSFHLGIVIQCRLVKVWS